MYHARLMGIAHCIVPQLLPIPIDQQSQNLLQQPSMELLASIMQPNQVHQMPMLQSPSIVQIIVPANSIPPHGHLIGKINQPEEIINAAVTTSNSVINDTNIDEFLSSSTEKSQIESLQTQETPLRSVISTESTHQQQQQQQQDLELMERDDEIDEMILNEDLDSSDYNQDNDDKIKKQQRDRSDFRYVESFEGEKSNIPMQNFEPDPIDNETELKNIISENFSQIPAVLPVPKALSSAKESTEDQLDDEPPEIVQQDEAASIL